MNAWRQGALVVGALAASSILASCLLLRDVDALTGAGDGDGSSDSPVDVGDAGEDALADAGCPGTAGPVGILIPGPNGYCIDSTEVTVGHYRAFLAARAGDTSGQPAACAWNDTFVPKFGVPDPKYDREPIAQVDWCDAVGYCSWAGKRLCGAVQGAPLQPADIQDTRGQWFRACSRNKDGLHGYPYGGDTPDLAACNGADSDAGGLREVGSFRKCEGGYPGLFDMAGNVREWEDSCTPGATPIDATCLARGGGAFDVPSTLRCDNSQLTNVADRNPQVGFRCCSR